MSSRLQRDEALEKEDRIDEMKKIKNSPPVPHLLQAQQAPAVLYAKVVGRPGTGSYPAPSPDPTKYDLHPSNSLQDIRQNHWTMKHRPRNDANLCVTLIHNPKYNIPQSNSLQDIKQNHWPTKYRSLIYRYFMR